MSWLQIFKKKLSIWSVIFSYSVQQWTISQLDCDTWWKVDRIWQLAMTSSMAGQRQKLQSTSQNQTCPPENVMVTVRWSAACAIRSNFLNPSKTITSEKYAQHQWDALKIAKPATGTGQQKGPNSSQQSLTAHCTTRAPKVERMSYYILSLLPYSPDHLPSDYHLFKYLDKFLQRKCSHKQLEAENDFRELLKFWSADFYAIGINKHFSLAKMCWL